LTNLTPQLQADVDAINKIDAIPSILKVICYTTGMGFAAVARVTDNRWVACAVQDDISFGLLPGGELKLETTLCNEVRQHNAGVIIDHVSKNKVYYNHHCPAMYGFESYISIPIITKSGDFFGTLCVIDPKPRILENPETIAMFELYTDLIAFHLNAVEQLSRSEARLVEERQNAELREQFIAILGHDLRNPVGAVANVAQLLLRMPLEDRVKKLANILQDSSYRMKGLIDNILDFARGRMGEGINLNLKRTNLNGILNQVITELQLTSPEREIKALINLPGDIYCDANRIGQLFSNLLGNAVTHGGKGEPILVETNNEDGVFTLSVINSGQPIPDKIKDRLFQPFYRGEAEPSKQGLGLGLYISSEIAKAHGGNLSVSSTPGETRFTFTFTSLSN